MFMKKTELLFTGLGRSVLGKIMPSQDFGHCFSQYGPPGGRITYIRVPEIELKATGHVKYMYIDLLAFLIGKLRYKGSQSHYPDIYDL